jgi:uncharacterized protein
MLLGFPFEMKELTEDGTFEGLAATYTLDLGNDLIERGAFAKTLNASRDRPLLMGHKDPIGRVSLDDSPAGLVARGKLSLGVQAGRDAYTLLKDQVIRSMSIGYEAVKSTYVGEVRHLHEIKLWEISLVVFPMQPAAAVTSVKSLDHQSIQSALREMKAAVLSALQTK